MDSEKPSAMPGDETRGQRITRIVMWIVFALLTLGIFVAAIVDR